VEPAAAANKRRLISKMWPYLLILLAFAADRFSKWWVAKNVVHGGSIDLGPWLTLSPVYNRGIAFGWLQGLGPLVGWVSIAVVIGMFVYLTQVPRSLRLLRIGLALVIGGAMGNLLDRVTVGQVLDFIVIPLRPGVFNVADIMINLGVGLTLLGALLQRRGGESLAESAETD